MNQTNAPNVDSISSALSGMLDYRLHQLPEEENETAERFAESLADMIGTPQIHGPDLDLCESITSIEVESRGKPWNGAIITFHVESSPDGVFVELPEPSAFELYQELANFYRGARDETR